MTVLRYEDTVQAEIAPCADCGALVDETDANVEEFECTGEIVCNDCRDDRAERRAERFWE